MNTKIQRWGNSQGLRIPCHLLQAVHVKVGDEVEVLAENGQIVVRPAHRIRGRYVLEDLLADYTNDVEAKELDWGKARGHEAW